MLGACHEVPLSFSFATDFTILTEASVVEHSFYMFSLSFLDKSFWEKVDFFKWQ
jgi:hypothetical protein